MIIIIFQFRQLILSYETHTGYKNQVKILESNKNQKSQKEEEAERKRTGLLTTGLLTTGLLDNWSFGQLAFLTTGQQTTGLLDNWSF